jgi:hypothetical protein
MEPIFTLPYSEYCVAQQLAKLLHSSQGYSLFAPLSRQEKGVDLIVTHRRERLLRAASIQIKGSRTYSDVAKSGRGNRYKYYTWFNNFDLPKEADFVALIAIYPSDEARSSRARSSWWAPVILLFTHAEMKRLLKSVKTREGKPDRMFGFGFNKESAIFQTRGNRHGKHPDFSEHLLKEKISFLRGFLMGAKER